MKVLFICTANVCRSPLAEGYLKHLLFSNPIPGLEVESAGVMALSGNSAFECAAETAVLSGFDISRHKSRPLTPALAQQSDRILCMETWQAGTVMDIGPLIASRTALLGSFHPAKGRLFQIPDPREFTVPCTLEVFSLIKHSVEGLYQKLRLQM